MMLVHNIYTRPTHQQPSFRQYQHQHHQHLDVDSSNLDPVDTDSVASSPHSTQSSLLSQYSNFQTTSLSTTFDTIPSAVPRGDNFKFPTTPHSYEVQNSQSLSQVPDLTPSEQWLLGSTQPQHPQQTPRAAHRLVHQREPSLSSLSSNGPASPYTANTSNPHIAVTDSSSSEMFHDMSGGESNYAYQSSGKSMSMNESFYATLQNLQAGNAGFQDEMPNMSAHPHHIKPDRSLLPAPELSNGSATRSYSHSVASSIAGGDSPATPSFQEPDEEGRRRKNVFSSMPKLDRTMTDVFGDELYSPNFTITSASPPPQTRLAMSPSNDVFAQRLQAANSHHLNTGQSPVSVSSRNQSPFRHGSPLAPVSNDFSQQSNQVRSNSAQQLKEKRKTEQDANSLQQVARKAEQQQQGTPSTISPKDAMLDFNEPADDSNFPLFSAQETNNFDLHQLSKSMPQQMQNFQSTTPLQNAFNFNMPTNIQVPQQYPFVARPRQRQQATPSVSTFSRVGSEDTNGSASPGSARRPMRTNADSGTYTCTYHGCTLRFDTPSMLQKHKREGHRQANALSTARPAVTSPGVPQTLLNTQAGPHRCDRINPSTGKSCDTVFSRPYDLTRHEDTIHNARKQKVRCDLCTEEKTFSRADALTRHYRVCHPDVEFPGKHRRRGGSHV
ncbi:uncharacterized protein BCR38DRAFT_210777 [Pseudomassariella vexata]|uniref:C2H2-type domain-containing protein n=1 Tax=Pseudomassariella vexata TaxID=1141098 RepID=A0A1Y2DYI0_9PEZI|nr:uncharacterized protein BCR38DRAFT_210777 [Pseudomassariella vexata]ORY64269.1 hypothetical protein BCR38DRAFT_210777 [Pseudomassariella vexata]